MSGCCWSARGRAGSAARDAGRAIPQRALPMVNPSLLAADGTSPHHLARHGVEGGFEDARAPPAAGTPPARYWARLGFRLRRRGGNGDEAGQPLGEPPGRAGRWSDRPLRRQHMGEVSNPSLGHDRCHLHFGGAGSFHPLPLPAARRLAREHLKRRRADRLVQPLGLAPQRRHHPHRRVPQGNAVCNLHPIRILWTPATHEREFTD